LEELGWLSDPSVFVDPPLPATVTELLTVHSYPYIQAVQQAQAIARGDRPEADLSLFGLGTADNPIFEDIHDGPALCAGASLQAMNTILESRAIHAYSPSGGMHHAMRAMASGFCVYNDCALAIAAAIEAGHRVCYVDLDAHHGDGVQSIFYDDPRVLTVSMHESGDYLFPGTGEANEIGSGPGLGASLNIPLPPLAGNAAMLLAYERIVEPAVRKFAPSILVTQTGCDTHHDDPLTDLNASLDLYPRLSHRLHALAHEVCEGRWLILGGGGYDPADVTPRAWTAFFGALQGRQVIDVALPSTWIAASIACGGRPPSTLLADTPCQLSEVPLSQVSTLFDRIEKQALTKVLSGI
jgi:acetoin utilization protein AcuC